MASSGLSETESHGNGPLYSLENILGDDHEKLEHPDVRPEGWDEEGAEREAAHGYCIECEGAWSHSFYPVIYLCDTASQINLRKCAAKHVWMTTAMCASQHSIERAAAKSMPQRL